MRNDKQVVLLTGATRGIGNAIARMLVDKGFQPALLCRDPRNLPALKQQFTSLGLDVWCCAVDLSSRHSIEECCKRIDCPLYAIVNNAGICDVQRIDHREPNNLFQDVINTNLLGPFYLTSELLSKMSRPGRIINIASQLGVEGRAGYGAYSASKFGLIGLTKCWAKELGSEGITVNAVCPGWVSTEMSAQDLERLAHAKGMDVKQYRDEICAPLELKRFNTPEEVASLVCYLLSDEAAGITGRDWLMQTLWNQE